MQWFLPELSGRSNSHQNFSVNAVCLCSEQLSKLISGWSSGNYSNRFCRQYVSLFASIVAILSLLLTSDRKSSRCKRSLLYICCLSLFLYSFFLNCLFLIVDNDAFFCLFLIVDNDTFLFIFSLLWIMMPFSSIIFTYFG